MSLKENYEAERKAVDSYVKSSLTWNERAKAVFAQGCNTYSKRADQFLEGVYPTHLDASIPKSLCDIVDTDGNPYVDYVCGLGSNLIDIRNNFSLPTTREVFLAERIKALFPCIDKLRILKTGSDACSAAVRIARAFNGKEKIYGVGYHGWHDTFISAEDPGVGTLKGKQEYRKFNNLDDLIWVIGPNKGGLENVSAVIIEPVQLDLNVRAQLTRIKKLCDEHKILLIFDEVITGFRVPKYSISNWYDIQPDLICLGKALGNGYPISVLGGREDIMETPGYFISNTHNGEASAITNALDTLDYLSEEKLLDLWSRGDYLNREFNRLASVLDTAGYPDKKLCMVGYPTRAELQGDEITKALFMQDMVKKGQFFGRARFLTFAHTYEVINETLRIAKEVIESIKAGTVKLEGELPKPVFRRN